MSKCKIVSVLFTILVIAACSERSNTVVDPRHYPVELNSIWEYNTNYIMEFFDSSGNLSEPDTIISENTIVQVLSDNDSLGGYKNLYRLKSTDLSNSQFSETVWYLDSDSGLYVIAYSSAGSSQPVLPKKHLDNKVEEIRATFKKLEILYFPLLTMSATEDSIIFYETPRKVIKYPIFTGSKWVEINTPFLIERVVQGTRKIESQIGTFNCTSINRTSNEPFWKHVTFDDYIDLNIGLISREVIIDSMLRIIEPGDTIGFYKLSSTSNLIRTE